ncbi:uncharacterized protein LOC114180295 [Vigna unguiculata]|uniref:uncharacterized protein LOC114180295 n=1 Tax=Vigna unguiculata TaxID=3917 RepID=UPI0010168C15|nr:uncharacterized protein LOC114180295 [Vigna unguiculata]
MRLLFETLNFEFVRSFVRSLKRSFWCGGNIGDNVCVQHSIVMKSGSSRIDCRQRKIGLKISQSTTSCSEIASKVCGCGERLLLLKAGTMKNKGRLFWRCRNWASNSHYNYFNGLMKRNVEVKVKNLNLKLSQEKELRKTKFVWKRRN